MHGNEPFAAPNSTDAVVWLNAFRRSGRGDRRHGVPLHQLNCSPEEYDQLRTLLCSRRPRKRAEWMCFAVFAVEWLCRNFEGEWSYEGILAELHLPRDLQFDYDEFEDALEKGWGIEVLRTPGGRDFFGSLLLQAMPIRALTSQRGVLGRHLPRLLQAAADGASLDQLIEIATESRAELPVAWRGDTALALLAGMAQKLLHTNIEHVRGIDPVLRNVIAEFAHRRPPDLRIKRTIVANDSSFEWRHELVGPEVVHQSELQQILGAELPEGVVKWELFVQTRNGECSRVGVATLMDGPDRPYRLVRDVIDGDLLEHWPLEIVAYGGQAMLGPAILPGNEPLGSLPWIFSPLSEDGTKSELLGQGSLSARRQSLLVALPEDGRFDTASIPARIGMLGERPLFKCSAPVIVRVGSSRYEIEPGADQDRSISHTLEGDILNEPVVGRPTFRGPPALVEVQEGRRRRLPGSALQWRPRAQAPWRSDVSSARGRVELRYVERAQLRWQGWARIVPPKFEVTVATIAEGECELWISGIEPGTSLDVETNCPARVVDRHHWRIEVTGEPRPTVTLVLRHADGESLRVRCRLPVDEVGFELSNGEQLADGSELGLDELHLVRAIASDPRRGQARLTIRARIGKATSEFSSPLSARGRFELLRIRDRLRMALAANLCIEAPVHVMVDNGSVQRKIVVRRWSRRIHCDEGRVTLSNRHGQLEPEQLVDVEVEALSFVDPANRVQLRRVETGFSMPGNSIPEPNLLLVARSRGRTWACPRSCSRAKLAGDMGLFGLVAAPCSTELARRIGGDRREMRESESAEFDHAPRAEQLDLARALRIVEKPARCAALDGVLSSLIDDSQHPDWKILDCYVSTLCDIHASTFDVFERILRQPALAALILLRARVSDFDRIWIGFEDLPFSWDLIAISDWLRAARSIARAWQDGMFLEAHFDRIAALAARRSSSASLVFQCIAAELFGRRDCSQQLELIATALGPSLVKARDRALQQLLRSVIDTWPSAPGVSRLADWFEEVQPCLHDLVPRPPPGCGFRKPLLAAPAIAALLVVDPDALAPFIREQRMDVVQLLTELRLLEAGYPEWYSECFTLTLQLAAARRRHILLTRHHD